MTNMTVKSQRKRRAQLWQGAFLKKRWEIGVSTAEKNENKRDSKATACGRVYQKISASSHLASRTHSHRLLQLRRVVLVDIAGVVELDEHLLSLNLRVVYLYPRLLLEQRLAHEHLWQFCCRLFDKGSNERPRENEKASARTVGHMKRAIYKSDNNKKQQKRVPDSYQQTEGNSTADSKNWKKKNKSTGQGRTGRVFQHMKK